MSYVDGPLARQPHHRHHRRCSRLLRFFGDCCGVGGIPERAMPVARFSGQFSLGTQAIFLALVIDSSFQSSKFCYSSTKEADQQLEAELSIL